MSELEPSVVYRDGRLTARDYEEAIQALRDAATQLEPDGRNCVICHDGGHQAAECHHNPLVMARRYATASDVWKCFHCGIGFITELGAQAHFGSSEEEIARCLVAQLDMVCELHPWLPWPHDECSGLGCPPSAGVGIMRQKVRALQIAVQAREAMIVSAYVATDAPPTLDDILRWLSTEAEWWCGDLGHQKAADYRRFQTNLIYTRLCEWRDAGKEPKHGLD